MATFRNQTQDTPDYPPLKQPTRSGSGVQKSSSFNEHFRRKRSRTRRIVHTVPSDKDENERIEKYRKECLSKAIQWNTVDLIKDSKSFNVDDAYSLDVLTNDELKQLRELADKKAKFRMFLCFLREKKFDKMRLWISKCGLDEQIIHKIWETYEEFSDKELNRKKMKCFCCRLSSTFHAIVVADHLFSAGVIDELLYKRIIKTKLHAPVAEQIDLWNNIFRQCKAYQYPIYVINAFKITLMDAAEDAIELKGDFDDLLTELETFTDDPTGLLQCYCSKICTKALHPLSCVESLPISPVYFQPSSQSSSEGTMQKSVINSDESSGCETNPNSPETSCNSDDTGAEADCESPEPFITSNTSLQNNAIETNTKLPKKQHGFKGQCNPQYNHYETASANSTEDDVDANTARLRDAHIVGRSELLDHHASRRRRTEIDEVGRMIIGTGVYNKSQSMEKRVACGARVISKNVSIGCTNIYITK